MSNSLEGFLVFGSAFGLLFAIVYFGFVKPFKENMKKSGETWKDIIEQSERDYQAEKSKPFFSGGALIILSILFIYWWLYMEFSMIIPALIWLGILFFGNRYRR